MYKYFDVRQNVCVCACVCSDRLKGWINTSEVGLRHLILVFLPGLLPMLLVFADVRCHFGQWFQLLGRNKLKFIYEIVKMLIACINVRFLQSKTRDMNNVRVDLPECNEIQPIDANTHRADTDNAVKVMYIDVYKYTE